MQVLPITSTVSPKKSTPQVFGFGAGDVLDFSASNTTSVSNVSFTNGVVDLTSAHKGSVASIRLIGISAANDALLNSVASFNSVFGAGTIV